MPIYHPSIIQSMLQKSGGANIHFRGYQDKGKTMSMVLCYQYLIDHEGYTPYEAVGNLHIGSEINSQGFHCGGKYGTGFTSMKGDELRQYLWNMIHTPYRHKIIMIDEIDSEFPARNFMEKEQSTIMSRLWHNMKLRNYILYTSHLGNGTDLILRLATNFMILPQEVDFQNNIIPITVINGVDGDVYDADILGVNKALENYDRWELTEETSEDIPPRPISKAKKDVVNKQLRSAKDKFKHIEETSFKIKPSTTRNLRELELSKLNRNKL